MISIGVVIGLVLISISTLKVAENIVDASVSDIDHNQEYKHIAAIYETDDVAIETITIPLDSWSKNKWQHKRIVELSDGTSVQLHIDNDGEEIKEIKRK